MGKQGGATSANHSSQVTDNAVLLAPWFGIPHHLANPGRLANPWDIR